MIGNDEIRVQLKSIIQEDFHREFEKTIIARNTLEALSNVLVFFSYSLQIGTTVLAFSSSISHNYLLGIIAGGLGVCTTICMLANQYCSLQYKIVVQKIETMADKVNSTSVVSARNLSERNLRTAPHFTERFHLPSYDIANSLSQCSSPIDAASPLPEERITTSYNTFVQGNSATFDNARTSVPSRRKSLVAIRDFLNSQRNFSLRSCASEPTPEPPRLSDLSLPETPADNMETPISRPINIYSQMVRERVEITEHANSEKNSRHSRVPSYLKPRLRK